MPIANTHRGVWSPPEKVTELPKGALNDMLTNPANKVTGDSVESRLTEVPGASAFPLVLLGLVVACVVGSWGMFAIQPKTGDMPTSAPTSAPAGILPEVTRQNAAEPSRTPKPTKVPEPTRDYLGEAKAAVALTEWRYTEVAIAATQAQEQADAINRAAEATATQAAALVTSTAIANQGIINLAFANTAVAARAAGTATQQVVDLQTARTMADVKTYGFIFLFFVVALVVALVGWAAVRLLSVWTVKAQSENQAAVVDEFVKDNVRNEREVIQTNIDNGGGYGGAMQSDGLTMAEKHTIKRQLSAGRKIGFQPDTGMIPKVNGFSRDELESVIARLLAVGYVTKRNDGSAELTDEGKRYFGIA